MGGGGPYYTRLESTCNLDYDSMPFILINENIVI